jgi:ribosomal protein S18 acetylase RimI-like enzyme
MTTAEGIRVRPATAADLALLGAIEAAAASIFPAERIPAPAAVHSQAEFRAYLDAGLLWVAMEREGVVGFLAGRRLDGALHIDEVDVHPDYGRRGIGTALLQHALAARAALGLGRATLTTFRDIPWNAPYYRRLGFRELSDAEVSEALRELLERERRAGLSDRVAMVCT